MYNAQSYLVHQAYTDGYRLVGGELRLGEAGEHVIEPDRRYAYRTFRLKYAGRWHHLAVHRLSAYIRFGEPALRVGTLVRHIDGDRANNDPTNLRLEERTPTPGQLRKAEESVEALKQEWKAWQIEVFRRQTEVAAEMDQKIAAYRAKVEARAARREAKQAAIALADKRRDAAARHKEEAEARARDRARKEAERREQKARRVEQAERRVTERFRGVAGWLSEDEAAKALEIDGADARAVLMRYRRYVKIQTRIGGVWPARYVLAVARVRDDDVRPLCPTFVDHYAVAEKLIRNA